MVHNPSMITPHVLPETNQGNFKHLASLIAINPQNIVSLTVIPSPAPGDDREAWLRKSFKAKEVDAFLRLVSVEYPDIDTYYSVMGLLLCDRSYPMKADLLFITTRFTFHSKRQEGGEVLRMMTKSVPEATVNIFDPMGGDGIGDSYANICDDPIGYFYEGKQGKAFFETELCDHWTRLAQDDIGKPQLPIKEKRDKEKRDWEW
ncbi:MAG: hypothetical protein AAF152_09720 [Cyanobacteria bacterium P01_A01_bin.114]